MIRSFLIALFTAVALGTSFGALAAIDVNKASAAELEAVRGVGPSLSSKIVDERKNGAFKNWDDLITRVRGVGPASAVRLSNGGMTVGDSTYTASATVKPAKTPKATKSASAAKPVKSDAK